MGVDSQMRRKIEAARGRGNGGMIRLALTRRLLGRVQMKKSFRQVVEKMLANVHGTYDAERKEYREFVEHYSRRRGGGPGPNVRFDGCKRRDDALAKLQPLVDQIPFVEAGLISVAEAVKAAGCGGIGVSIEKAGHFIAEPGHIRIERDQNRDINQENDGREIAERMFGVTPGTLGRTTQSRNDSIDQSNFPKSIRR